jgi:hypothetical protein
VESNSIRWKLQSGKNQGLVLGVEKGWSSAGMRYILGGASLSKQLPASLEPPRGDSCNSAVRNVVHQMELKNNLRAV